MSIQCPKCHHENPDDTIYCGKCTTPLKPPEDVEVTETIETPKEELTTGSTFAGRYQIIEELGKGGMGKVYKAHDTKIKEKIALKLIKPEIAKDKKTIERFNNELRVARRIRHKNVCQMFDLGEDKGTHFITMEFVDGQDLKKLIRQTGQLAIGTTINIAKQVCDGLVEAHTLGVVHRDLKPSNIMIDSDGNARIMDFGIARSLKAKGITGAGVMIGTPEYMSPEQVEGKEVDQRSDIYSLGVILYEMVTGGVPFEGDTPLSIAVKHKTESPPDPKDLNAQIPNDLSHVILHCLEKEKEKRYQRAEDVLTGLENIEKGLPTTEKIVTKRKPLTSKEITVTFGLKKLLIPALAVIALAVIAIVIWQLVPQKKAAPLAPEGKPSLAVMHFKNNTGDESLDHLRTMLPDLLITDLSQSKYLRVLSREKLFEILGQLDQLAAETYSADVLQEVAVQGGINHVLLGSYARMGGVFRIDVVIQKASTGEIIGSDRIEARGEEDVFPKVDELTKRIKTNFKLSDEEIASDLDRDVGMITTSSPEAYKLYIEGKKYLATNNRRSIRLFEKAIEIDPEFAMAYQRMSIAYWGLGLLTERKKSIQKALELSDRISDRERYLIQGNFYQNSEKTYDKAIEAYTNLLELYPEDIIVNIPLGILYRDLEEWDRAVERYEVNVNTKHVALGSYIGLARAYRGKGFYDEANKALETYITNFSDNAKCHREKVINYYEQGKLDLALAEMDKAFLLDSTHHENFVYTGEIYVYREDFIKAEEQYQKLLDAREPIGRMRGITHLARFYRLQGEFEKAKSMSNQGIELTREMGEYRWGSDFHRDLAQIHLRTGNPEQAIKECDLALESASDIEDLDRQRRALYTKGLAYLEMKSFEETQRVADKLLEVIEEGMKKKAIRLHYHLMGMMELENGNYAKAIVNFKDALALLSGGPLTKRADFIDSLALAFYKAGNSENARKEYEKLTSLTTGRDGHGEIYAKSFYMLGKIYEQQGNKAKAIEYYEKFLSLWKDADLGIAEVEDAKKRLAGLKQ